jgi:calcineurin-like phosphoesterase
MIGPIDSVIGDNADDVLSRFLTGIPNRLTVAEGRVMFNGVLVEIDPNSGKAIKIERIYQEVD